MKLHEGDSYKVLRRMIERGELVDSVVTDPPYGLVSITKRFGAENAAPAKYGRDGAFSRISKGFMGNKWDGSGVERDPEFWRLVYEVMKPGAYIVAFSAASSYHRMATAIEHAGFITHPLIGWTYASGAPKPHSAARAIDQALGVKGSIEAAGNPVRRMRPGADQNRTGKWEKLEDRVYQPGRYVPASEEAEEWDGWFYGGQARKPALEPIYVGQKPFSEKNGALNILKHGVGAVNIEDCRVPSESSDPRGRWPANLIHDDSPEVRALFPYSKGAQAPVKGSEPSKATKNVYGDWEKRHQIDQRDGGGSASRFFERYTYRCYECGDRGWIAEDDGLGTDIQVACPSCGGSCNDPLPFDGIPILYNPKANKLDRAGSGHPTVKPIALLRSLIRHVTPRGGLVLDPFAGSGTTGQAAREEGFEAVLIEADANYADDIRRRLKLPARKVLADLRELLGEPVRKKPALDLSDII